VERHLARESHALRYVLLVGDDSFEPLDYSGRGVPSFLPSLFARDSAWGWVPSENLHADLDDDGLPDVAIGRLPVRTVADAEVVADKIASQDARASTSWAIPRSCSSVPGPSRGSPQPRRPGRRDRALG
jgi:hypothetical protein